MELFVEGDARVGVQLRTLANVLLPEGSMLRYVPSDGGYYLSGQPDELDFLGYQLRSQGMKAYTMEVTR